MVQLPSFLSSVLPKRVEDSYAALSHDENSDDTVPQSHNEKRADPAAGEIRTAEYQGLLKQCFIYISLSILFIIACTTIIVATGTAKCRSPSTTAPAAIPQPILNIPHAAPTKAPIDCGKNAETARKRGCHFDIISFTWLRHECFDRELTEQFSREKKWQWSLDSNGTSLVSEEQMRNGDVEVGWVTWEYHLTHCLYTWKKLIRAVEKRAPIDGYIANINHTSHCSKLLLARGGKMEAWNSEFFVQYPLCYL
ncbi:hypothetical protein GP486_004105 [Trichoglossum hirsutum]|uniref:Uncharacterized protein n=1 Tax=Trichoglossum hirsutum TaxID=265104 RepID=A0A9P8RQ79_9PEZI|nr:hypothetical protein GP486_004105 [Trichoglossum hirsutum]